MTKVFTTIALAFAFHYSYAQKFSDSLSANTTFIRFNPVGLADLNDINISFGAEKRITKKSSFAFDAAFIFYSQLFDDISHRSRGFIFRPAYRFKPGKSNFFLEAELHYKQVTHRLTDWVGRDVVNDVPSYEEFMTFRLRKSVIGAHMKAGRQFFASNRIWLELYLGIGLHLRRYKIVDHPEMRYTINYELNSITTNNTELLPALPAGFRLLYRLNK